MMLKCEEEFNRRNNLKTVSIVSKQPPKPANPLMTHQTSLISGSGAIGSDKSLGDSMQVLREMEDYSLMIHEFLYLVCNAYDRVQTIEQNFKVNRAPVKLNIEQWELKNSCNLHIYLLTPDAFKNQAPHHVVTEALIRQAAKQPLRFVGPDPHTQKTERFDAMF
jgi:hypothetical protein